MRNWLVLKLLEWIKPDVIIRDTYDNPAVSLGKNHRKGNYSLVFWNNNTGWEVELDRDTGARVARDVMKASGCTLGDVARVMGKD